MQIKLKAKTGIESFPFKAECSQLQNMMFNSKIIAP